ncbi:MAG: zeta toxin [Planctomycetaceae bacterium]|nr:zeta toxin [Paracoccaceae bacterium]MCA9040698.1 zeta toxin [Planctomycetaceae bacterium]
MSLENPAIVVLAGPNGSGKSTYASAFLKTQFDIPQFVNADVIAQGLSPFDPESVAIKAGRIMLTHMKDLASSRESFSFESTLSSRSFAPWIEKQIAIGYHFHLIYFWLASPDLAVSRVSDRVKCGGHDIPDEVIRRRYYRSLRNFFEIYQPLTTRWIVYNNSHSTPSRPTIIARGAGTTTLQVYDDLCWKHIEKGKPGGN